MLGRSNWRSAKSERCAPEVIKIAKKVLLKELSSELSWRLTIYGLFSSTIVFATTFFQERKDTNVAVTWLCLCLLYLVFHHSMIRAKSVRNMFRFAFLLASIGFLWWGMLPLFYLSSEILTNFVFCLLIFSLGTLTLPGQAILPLYVGLITVSFSLVQISSHQFLWSVVICFVLLISVRSSLTHYARFMTRIAIAVFSRLLDVASPKDMLHLLRWMLGHILAIDQMVVLQNRNELLVVNGDDEQSVSLPQTEIQAIRECVVNSGSTAGVLSAKEIAEQKILKRYFKPFPLHLVFFRLAYADEHGDEDLYLFAPVNFWMYLGSLQKIFRGLYTFTSLVQYSFASQKNSIISSSRFLDIEKSNAQQADQYREVVHRVNNLVQEMNIQSDRLRSFLSQEKDKNALEELAVLEDNIQKLAYELSDLQLVRELLSIRSLKRKEYLPIGRFIESVESWASLYSSSVTLNVNIDEEESQRVICLVSEDYLGALLRSIFKIIYKQYKTIELSLSMKQRGEDMALLCILPLSTHSFMGDSGQLADLVRALRRFAALSGGSVENIEEDNVCLELPFEQFVAPKRRFESDWMLLVDDNKDVLSFYSGIAEALQIQYELASSISAAQEILESRGVPMLLLTDIHIDDGSGLDLAKECRARFGKSFPILVVSGAADEAVEDVMSGLGVTSFLVKPVSRRKLFQVVKELIGR